MPMYTAIEFDFLASRSVSCQVPPVSNIQGFFDSPPIIKQTDIGVLEVSRYVIPILYTAYYHSAGS